MTAQTAYWVRGSFREAQIDSQTDHGVKSPPIDYDPAESNASGAGHQ
jgi:hypothetical protein